VTDSGAKQVKVATGLDVPIKILVPLFFSTGDSTQFTLIGLGDIVLPGLLLCFAMRFDDSKVLDPELIIFSKSTQNRRVRTSANLSVSEGQSLFAPQCKGASSPPQFSPASFSSLICRPPIPQHPSTSPVLYPSRAKVEISIIVMTLLPCTPPPDPQGISFPSATGYFAATMIGYCVGLSICEFVVGTFHLAQPAMIYLVPGTLIPFAYIAQSRGELGEAWEGLTGGSHQRLGGGIDFP